ncbi:hypothetical protein [Bradyrhizobium sp. Arg816]|uniref:hypothetical protein n=1 Tax=Bradyrhizobium sp. Arg816 TaxID=2998491 RepID=UPI00249F6C61|nr:hypothetical protein [Bradyrhizobium sp. Arg816]MDI3567239.1 hypothetical protein [Bradyrhizobium sp. Arg816]
MEIGKRNRFVGAWQAADLQVAIRADVEHADVQKPPRQRGGCPLMDRDLQLSVEGPDLSQRSSDRDQATVEFAAMLRVSIHDIAKGLQAA